VKIDEKFIEQEKVQQSKKPKVEERKQKPK